MAEKEIRSENNNNHNNEAKGEGKSRQHRPHNKNKPYGKGGARPNRPAHKDVKEPKEAKELKEAKEPKAAKEGGHTEHKHHHHKPFRNEKHGNKQDRPRKEHSSEEKKHEERAPKKESAFAPVVSPRRRQMQELLTAEQKAFADASDILLAAEEKRKEQPLEEKEPESTVEIVGVRFKPMGKIYYFDPAGISFEQDNGVIVETSRGQEYGYVVVPNRMIDEKETVQPLKPVVRKATAIDEDKYRLNKQLEKKAAEVWEQLVAKHNLKMRLNEIEYTFDNTKLIFFFSAEGRVDFRELVKDLAAVFHTRIELRQIGVRDEARYLGGLGVCGMPFCCNRFLTDIVQVSIKMAKEQNLAMSSSKLSGNCGRLMCCLRYEQDVYEMEHKTFPKADMLVRTASGTGVVTESNFLNNKIKVRLDNGDGNAAIKTFTREEVKVIGSAKPKKDERKDEQVEKELKMLED